MNQIKEVAEGAYFVPSYSDQTIVGYQPGVGTQSVVNVREDEASLPSTEIPPQVLPEPRPLNHRPAE